MGAPRLDAHPHFSCRATQVELRPSSARNALFRHWASAPGINGILDTPYETRSSLARAGSVFWPVRFFLCGAADFQVG